MYENSRTVCGKSDSLVQEECEIRSGISSEPFLFAVAMDRMTDDYWQEFPCATMFVDDIAIFIEIREKVEKDLERWRYELESQMRV